MGLLDYALGTANPVSQYVDSNPNTIHGLFSGLATGQNISDGLSQAAQNANSGALADRVLQQQMGARNQTADWLAAQPNPNLAKLAPMVRSGLLSGADALTMAFKPGTTVDPGATYLPNPLDPSNTGVPSAPAQLPTPPAAPPIAAPAATTPTPVPLPQINPDDPTVADRAQQLQQAFVAAGDPATDPSTPPGAIGATASNPPVPLASPSVAQPQVPIGATPAGYVPGQPFTAPATDPLKMTAPQRIAAAASQGLKPGDPGYANFVLTGRLPNNATETWRPATAADLTANGIAANDPSVYQVSTMGQVRQIPGAISASDNAAPLGTTGSSTIDPTQPGYSSTPVVAGKTQAAIDQAALSNLTNGTTPPVGRTGAAGAQSTAISNRMAELDPSGNLAANRSQLKSLTQSLATQQKYLDTTQRSISNAEQGFQQVVSAFQGKVNMSQYPTINAMENAAKAQLSAGDISAYQAGLAEVANEYTQVFSRGGQASDTVRAKSASIVNGNLSIGDLNGVLKELQTQGNIVVQGSKDQVQRITDQINGIATGTGSPDAVTTAAPQYQEGQTATNPTTGAKVVYQGGQWVPANG